MLRSLVIPLTLAMLLVGGAAVVRTQGFTEEAARQLIRFTATTSLLLFSLAWSASALNGLLAGDWQHVLHARRRMGIAFALSHTAHLAAIAWLVELAFDGDWLQVDPLGGAVIYAFTYLMAFTSNNASVRLLGARNWRWLHWVGGYVIWVAFTQSYLSNSFQREGLHYPVFAVLCGAIFAVRIVAFIRSRAHRRSLTTP